MDEQHHRWTDRLYAWLLSGIGILLSALIAVIIWIFGGLPEEIRMMREEMTSFRGDIVYLKRSSNAIELLVRDQATQGEQIKSIGKNVERLENKADDHEKRITRVEVKVKF